MPAIEVAMPQYLQGIPVSWIGIMWLIEILDPIISYKAIADLKASVIKIKGGNDESTHLGKR